MWCQTFIHTTTYCTAIRRYVTLQNALKGGIFIAKLIPMIRTIVSIPAGVVHMKMGNYALSSALGTAARNFVFLRAGYVLGDQVFQLLGLV